MLLLARGVHSPTRELSFSFLLSFLWASILILAVVCVVYVKELSMFGVEHGVGPDRRLISVMVVVDQVFR
jgi:hypothetical protein